MRTLYVVTMLRASGSIYLPKAETAVFQNPKSARDKADELRAAFPNAVVKVHSFRGEI